MTPYDLDALRPMDCPDLVRLGNPSDGGYVLPRSAALRAGALLSFGMNCDWTLERAFARLNPDAPVHAYDHTVGRWRFARRSIGAFLGIPLSLLPPRVRSLRRRLHNTRLWLDYEVFFRGRIRHWRQRVWDADESVSVTLATALGRLPVETRQEILLKVDIEGAEYRVLPGLLRAPETVGCLMVEFHELESQGRNLDRLVRELSPNFAPVHVHANNYEGLIPTTTHPRALEVTFLAKRHLPANAIPVVCRYPREGLDAPNNPGRPEVPIIFG